MGIPQCIAQFVEGLPATTSTSINAFLPFQLVVNLTLDESMKEFCHILSNSSPEALVLLLVVQYFGMVSFEFAGICQNSRTGAVLPTTLVDHMAPFPRAMSPWHEIRK